VVVAWRSAPDQVEAPPVPTPDRHAESGLLRRRLEDNELFGPIPVDVSQFNFHKRGVNGRTAPQVQIPAAPVADDEWLAGNLPAG
jgi:hypothetical protein